MKQKTHAQLRTFICNKKTSSYLNSSHGTTIILCLNIRKLYTNLMQRSTLVQLRTFIAAFHMAHVVLYVSLLVLLWSPVHADSLYSRSQSLNLTGGSHAVAGSAAHCAWLCEGDDSCTVAEFRDEEGVCVMSNAGTTAPSYIGIPEPGVDPPTQPDDTVVLGDGMHLTRQGAPGASKPRSCADILSDNSASVSGVYVIWPDNVTESRVWCDMDTDGGGWTMVYSYKTVYEILENNLNAVTPFPTWPVNRVDLTPRSTTPPSDLHEFGALDFPLWEHVGDEFLIKSNINNWLACEPGTGSMSRWVDGTLSCRLIKSITSQCPGLPDGQFSFFLYVTGPCVRTDAGWVYAFIGSTAENWPVHDPCATTAAKHETGVWPKGQIWLR